MIKLKTIMKLALPDGQGIRVVYAFPSDAKIVHVGLINGRGFFWVEFNQDRQAVDRTFFVAPTGMDVPDDWDYQGSADSTERQFHLYEIPSTNA